MGHEKSAESTVPPVADEAGTMAATVQSTRLLLCSMMKSGAEFILAVGKLQFNANWPVALFVSLPPVGNGGVAIVTTNSSEKALSKPVELIDFTAKK